MHETGLIVLSLIGVATASATIGAITHATRTPKRLIAVPAIIVAISIPIIPILITIRVSRRLLSTICTRIISTLSVVVIIIIVIFSLIIIIVIVVIVVVVRHSIVAIIVFVTILIAIRIIFANLLHANSSDFLQFIFAWAIFRSTP